MFRAISDAQLCVLPNAGHGVVPEETILRSSTSLSRAPDSPRMNVRYCLISRRGPSALRGDRMFTRSPVQAAPIGISAYAVPALSRVPDLCAVRGGEATTADRFEKDAGRT